MPWRYPNTRFPGAEPATLPKYVWSWRTLTDPAKPLTYFGRVLDLDGNTIWSCPHEHATQDEAKECAEREYALLGISRTGYVHRASGDCVCPGCGKSYREHPHDAEDLDWLGKPFLRVLCNGSRVKL